MSDPSQDLATTQRLDEALAQIEAVIASDGFTCDWQQNADGTIKLRILETETACQECLVPKAVIQAILDDALAGTDHKVTDIELPDTTDES
jgi:Fe-S cluster biogenesis protein NfuA